MFLAKIFIRVIQYNGQSCTFWMEAKKQPAGERAEDWGGRRKTWLIQKEKPKIVRSTFNKSPIFADEKHHSQINSHVQYS